MRRWSRARQWADDRLREPDPASNASPLLALPGAVSGDGIDAPVAAHYGSFNGEQRTLAAGDGFVDLSHRGVLRVSGPDRLTWLHSLTTQHLEALAPGVPTAGAGALAQRSRRARDIRHRRRRGVHCAHRAGPGGRAGRVAGPDAVHDARGGRGPDRGARGRLAPDPGRPSPAGTGPASTTSSRARNWTSTPRQPARRAACGPSRRSGSPAANPASVWTPTTGRSPTRWAGFRPPYTSTRGATAARRPSRACTPWVGRPVD